MLLKLIIQKKTIRISLFKSTCVTYTTVDWAQNNSCRCIRVAQHRSSEPIVIYWRRKEFKNSKVYHEFTTALALLNKCTTFFFRSKNCMIFNWERTPSVTCWSHHVFLLSCASHNLFFPDEENWQLLKQLEA